MTTPNTSPIAHAGPDVQLVLASGSQAFWLDGSRSRDADGAIITARWRQLSGPAPAVITNPSNIQTMVTGLAAGSYQFELTVTDNRGASARDTMMATVTARPNQGPVANAGNDAQVQLGGAGASVVLDGSQSFDPDGTIVAFSWALVGGPAQAVISMPNAQQTLAQLTGPGVYQFELTITDDRGATARDSVLVTVTSAAAPCGPIAQAGRDVLVLWPADNATLDGSASSSPDGAIIAWGWEQVGGPAAGSAQGHDRARLSLTGLARGVYRFRLTVTDGRGRSGSDEVLVTVARSGAGG